ncbi:FAD-dependent oxidoreductase [Candidatus Mycolicibacterium alkanivorans]|uniref:ferredoxin--NADP(+) reductase n=1 Tax=Candidatus Mycolicibacterium alkanivorans TaxID=2954114 RepID=A0ABS9YS23_9MYCO|nr:FAD-dependent oxidoreductase [Candidatus Mycolicibacterium alkanivorans]MCI4673624.1 FAD-dependent oxidoreductase [Candidatus Mycolicibacterium alkanivorans]
MRKESELREHRPLRVAVVGAGPAGIYAAEALLKSDVDVAVDVLERLPAPFGLIRYGVAPDHPRIKGIITALHRVLDKPGVRLFGNVDYGTDLGLDDLRSMYDAVVFSTGANSDRPLPIPGIELGGSFGAADFVSWYNGHPDVPRNWPLTARKVAVIGAGNVALDVARMLAKTADELLPTEIPPNVYQGLKVNEATEVHLFCRRGPVQAKFTPLELWELDTSPNIEVVVDPEDIDYDDASVQARRSSMIVDQVTAVIEKYALRDPGNRPHRVHLHFFENPVEVVGDNGRVTGLRTERTELDGTGNVRSTGRFTDWDVQAVYRAVGYLSEPVAKLPFDDDNGTIPNEAGRVLDEDDRRLAGVYVTGWIKRGPVGLIGHTRSDAEETIACLLEDYRNGILDAPQDPSPEAMPTFLASHRCPYTTWEGWLRLDARERAIGEGQDRERVKVVEREAMLDASADPG